MRNTKHSLPLIMLGAMLVAGAGATAWAQPGPGAGALPCPATCSMPDGPGMRGGQGGPGAGWDRMVGRLDLGDDQKSAIEGIRNDAQEKNLPLRKQIMQLENDLRGEMLKDNPNDDAVTKLVAKIGQVRTDIQTNRVKAQLAIRKQLTPEQRDQMLLMRGDGPGHGRRGGHCARAGRAPRMGKDKRDS